MKKGELNMTLREKYQGVARGLDTGKCEQFILERGNGEKREQEAAIEGERS